jgi:hypothetical protein
MTDRAFEQFLDERGADADTVQQALRTWLTRRASFMTPDEMRAELDAAVGDPKAVQETLARLERDSGALESASRYVLSQAWEEPGEADRIARAVDGAKAKMPIIEVGVLAIIVMYGMYLSQTGGIKSSQTTVERSPDGSQKTVETKVFHEPAGVLASMLGLFGGGATKAGE